MYYRANRWPSSKQEPLNQRRVNAGPTDFHSALRCTATQEAIQ